MQEYEIIPIEIIDEKSPIRLCILENNEYMMLIVYEYFVYDEAGRNYALSA